MTQQSAKLAETPPLQDKIRQYLHAGYCVKQFDPELLREVDASLPPEDPTPNSLNKLFDTVIQDALALADTKIILPISGGLDSRYILAGLLKHLPPSEIQSYTFGSPGLVDYQHGTFVAKKAGLRHQQIDLSTIEITWEQLVRTAVQTPWTFVFDSLFNRKAYELGSNSGDSILLGALGGPTTKRTLFSQNSSGIARDWFEDKEKWKSGFDFNEHIGIRNPLLRANHLVALNSLNNISVIDSIEMLARQANAIWPILIQTDPVGRLSLKTVHSDLQRSFITPFADPRWMSYFFLGAEENRRGQSMYRRALSELDPRISSFPQKHRLSPSISGVSTFIRSAAQKLNGDIQRKIGRATQYYRGGMNYVDFPLMFRKRADYIEVLDRSIDFADSRGMLTSIDLKKAREAHIRGTRNHSLFFQILIGLSANISAEEIVDDQG